MLIYVKFTGDLILKCPFLQTFPSYSDGSDRSHVHDDNHEEHEEIFDSEEEDNGTQVMDTKADWIESEIAYNISKSSGKQKRLPKALVFGIKKCGTGN